MWSSVLDWISCSHACFFVFAFLFVFLLLGLIFRDKASPIDMLHAASPRDVSSWPFQIQFVIVLKEEDEKLGEFLNINIS